MKINREELAWAAGLFEGEGCFSVSTNKGDRKPKYSPSATVVSTDEDVLQRFALVIGFGTISSRPLLPKHKPIFAWHVQNFEHFQALVALLWPWLHNRRRTRAKEILLGARRYFAQPAQRLGRPRGSKNRVVA